MRERTIINHFIISSSSIEWGYNTVIVCSNNSGQPSKQRGRRRRSRSSSGEKYYVI